MEQLIALIRPKVIIKMSHSIVLKGNEKVEPALGGELLLDKAGNYYINENNREPAGINFPNGFFVNIQSIEEIIIEE